MKRFLFLLTLFTFSFSVAQAPLAYVEKTEKAQLEADAYAAYVNAKTSIANVSTVPGALTDNRKYEVITNHPSVPDLITEFYHGAVYYKIDYAKELIKLKQVVFIDIEDNGFLGDVSRDGTTIRLNSELLQFPNLARVIFLRQMGNLYGLKNESKNSHEIMSEHWELDVRHEILARNLRERPWHRENFFTALNDKKPLEKRL